MRKVDLSVSGGAGGGTGSVGGGAGTASVATGSGPAAQAASSDSVRTKKPVRVLVVTEANTENIDLGRTQTAAQHIQLIEIIGRADVNTMVGAVVDFDALDV